MPTMDYSKNSPFSYKEGEYLWPTKRVTCALTAPNGTTAASAVDRTNRTVFATPMPTTRWRFRVSNNNLLTNTALTTPCTITEVFVGAPLFLASGTSTNRWNGDFVATPVRAISAPITVPVDGTDGYSDWVSDPSLQFEAQTPLCFSWGITSLNSGTGIASGNSYQGVFIAGASNAGVAAIPGSSINTNANYLDVRIEYEFEGNHPIAVHATDSLGLGYGDGTQGYASPGLGSLPYEAPPVAAGLMGNYAVCNLAVGSATTGTMISASNYAWTRADLETTIPDVGVIQLGTNSLGSVYSTNAVNLTGHFDILRNKGINKIYLATVTPRGLTANAGTLQAGVSAGATSISCSFNPGNVAILIGSGMNQEQVTVSNVTGTGPFTCTVGALVNAHTLGETISSGNELNRRRLNTWIRNIPYGITGIIDLDKLVELSNDSPSCDPRIVSADGLHFLRGGYIAIAKELSTINHVIRV